MTIMEINLDNLRYNAKQFDKNIIAVVKANAYGLGSIKVVEVLIEEGITHFAVANIQEALELKSIYKDIFILILSPISREYIKVANDNNIDVTVNSEEYFNENKDLLSNIHIKINSGMNRIGINKKEELDYIISNSYPHIKIRGIFSHFATADEVDSTMYYNQIQLFKEICSNQKLSTYEYVHISNSASTLYHSEIDVENYQRIGLALYGYYPNPMIESNIELKPVITLKSLVTQVTFIKAGTYIGYGFNFKTTKDSYIATIPIGYADGLFRTPKDFYVLINHNKYKVIGKICMDQMMVLVDNSVKFNDDVIIFNDELSIDSYAYSHNTISYEVLSKLSTRIKRVYL